MIIFLNLTSYIDGTTFVAPGTMNRVSASTVRVLCYPLCDPTCPRLPFIILLHVYTSLCLSTLIECTHLPSNGSILISSEPLHGPTHYGVDGGYQLSHGARRLANQASRTSPCLSARPLQLPNISIFTLSSRSHSCIRASSEGAEMLSFLTVIKRDS